jgi:hypothetical protein
MNDTHRRALHRALGLTLMLCMTGCSTSVRDNFICGVQGEGGTATRCDRPGERCICKYNRCAISTPTSRCPSGLKFSFPNTDNEHGIECVATEDVSPYALASSTNALCPGEGTQEIECGVPDGAGNFTRCLGAQELCLCTVRRCVIPWGGQCSAPDKVGLRYVYDRSCAPAMTQEELQQALPRDDGSCPGFGSPAVPQQPVQPFADLSEDT